jgi:hypothetical protein
VEEKKPKQGTRAPLYTRRLAPPLRSTASPARAACPLGHWPWATVRKMSLVVLKFQLPFTHVRGCASGLWAMLSLSLSIYAQYPVCKTISQKKRDGPTSVF